MCTPSVTSRYSDGKPTRPAEQSQADLEPGGEVPGWPGSASRQAAKRAKRAAPDAVEAADYVFASGAGLPRRLGILDRSLFNLTDGGHRLAPRQRSVILTDHERDNLRHLAGQAARCGNSWGAFRGFESREDGDYEIRLACQLKCGTRACRECSDRIRAREAWRVAGPWNLFLTLTLPRGRAAAADAWREIHGMIADFVREMRRETRIATMTEDENVALEKPYTKERIEQAREKIRASEGFEYAWVIEPHKDGWPHVHLVINTKWVDFVWMRELWSKCAGVADAWVYGEVVYQVNGACRYLCKYISKSVLTLDILAIMFRRRLWATSLKKPESKEAKYFREQTVGTKDAYEASEIAETWRAELGWKCVSFKAGAYAMWEREAADGEGYVWAIERSTGADEGAYNEEWSLDKPAWMPRRSATEADHEDWKWSRQEFCR